MRSTERSESLPERAVALIGGVDGCCVTQPPRASGWLLSTGMRQSARTSFLCLWTYCRRICLFDTPPAARRSSACVGPAAYDWSVLRGRCQAQSALLSSAELARLRAFRKRPLRRPQAPRGPRPPGHTGLGPRGMVRRDPSSPEASLSAYPPYSDYPLASHPQQPPPSSSARHAARPPPVPLASTSSAGGYSYQGISPTGSAPLAGQQAPVARHSGIRLGGGGGGPPSVLQAGSSGSSIFDDDAVSAAASLNAAHLDGQGSQSRRASMADSRQHQHQLHDQMSMSHPSFAAAGPIRSQVSRRVKPCASAAAHPSRTATRTDSAALFPSRSLTPSGLTQLLFSFFIQPYAAYPVPSPSTSPYPPPLPNSYAAYPGSQIAPGLIPAPLHADHYSRYQPYPDSSGALPPAFPSQAGPIAPLSDYSMFAAPPPPPPSATHLAPQPNAGPAMAAPGQPYNLAPAFTTQQGTFYFMPRPPQPPPPQAAPPPLQHAQYTQPQQQQQQQPPPLGRVAYHAAQPQLHQPQPHPLSHPHQPLPHPHAQMVMHEMDPYSDLAASGLPMSASMSASSSANGTHHHHPHPHPAGEMLARKRSTSSPEDLRPRKPRSHQQQGDGALKQPRKKAGKSLKDQPKRFVCEFEGCGRAFARAFNLQTHEKSHLNIRDCQSHPNPLYLIRLLECKLMLSHSPARSRLRALRQVVQSQARQRAPLRGGPPGGLQSGHGPADVVPGWGRRRGRVRRVEGLGRLRRANLIANDAVGVYIERLTGEGG